MKILIRWLFKFLTLRQSVNFFFLKKVSNLRSWQSPASSFSSKLLDETDQARLPDPAPERGPLQGVQPDDEVGREELPHRDLQSPSHGCQDIQLLRCG